MLEIATDKTTQFNNNSEFNSVYLLKNSLIFVT